MPVTHLPLSIVVIVLDEEQRVGDCLRSVAGLADDLVVIDGGSRDRTVEICRAHGARVWTHAWTGYSAQKNFGNALARHDWILSLDADERVSPELAASLRREFAHGLRCDAYVIRFENYFGPQRIRFGAWNPESHVRLFDRRKLAWDGASVHEGLRGPADVRLGRLAGCIRHHSVATPAELGAKTERYATLFAARLRRRGIAPPWTKVWLNPGWRFVRDYGLRLGALDGRAGALLAWEAARYTHQKYRRARPPAAARRTRAPWIPLGALATLLVVGLARLPSAATVFPWRANAQRPLHATAVHPAPAPLDDDETTASETLPSDADDEILI